MSCGCIVFWTVEEITIMIVDQMFGTRKLKSWKVEEIDSWNQHCILDSKRDHHNVFWIMENMTIMIVETMFETRKIKFRTVEEIDFWNTNNFNYLILIHQLMREEEEMKRKLDLVT